MKTNKLLVSAVLAIAVGTTIAGFLGNSSMTQPATSTGVRAPFLHGFFNAQPAGQSELASLERATEWINSPPLTASALRGKVVLVDFWTYTCINWLRTLPYVRAWSEKYKDRGLVVVGVHSPEFSFEKDLNNVRVAVKDMHVDYPVAVDSEHVIWRAFRNSYWPALYFIDAQGRIRHQQFGEGAYEQSEMIIQQLLREAGAGDISMETASVDGSGLEAAADWSSLRSGENYVGYDRTMNFASPGGAVLDKARMYELPARLRLNEWGLAGDWTVKQEAAVLNKANGRIAYRFHARDLHLVMGPKTPGTPVQFRVLIDGQAPGASHGSDVDEQGNGTLSQQRLHHLIRQQKPIADRQFEIEFLDPEAEALRSRLIDHGTAASTLDCLTCWGATLGGVVDPARSALGIQSDGHLVWAGAEHATVGVLADALLSARVMRAVELDINPEWVAGYLYGHRGGAGPLAPVPVVPGQQGIPGQYLAPWSRDFFTIVASSSHGP